MKKIVSICLPSIASDSKGQHSQQGQQESTLTELRVSLFVDKDRVPWLFPQRKFVARKLDMTYTSVCDCLLVSSLTFGRDSSPADTASKRRWPKSCGHNPLNLGNRPFGKPLWPKSVVVQGQGRVDCCGCMPGADPNPRHCLQSNKDWGQVCLPSWTPPSWLVLCFPCICSFTTRGNDEGSCVAKSSKQEDARCSPSSSIIYGAQVWAHHSTYRSWMVAVALAYGLMAVWIAINSILFAFGNAIILLLILFALFGWREFIGKFRKKRSAEK